MPHCQVAWQLGRAMAIRSIANLFATVATLGIVAPNANDDVDDACSDADTSALCV